MKENIFSYGTLQKEDVQLKLFGRRLNGSSDILEDFSVSTIEIYDETFLAKGEERIQKTLIPTGVCGDFVEGMLFEVSEDELLLVDAYEPRNFKRIKFVLKSGKSAWIYLAM